MDGPGKEFLARAALSQQQHGGLRFSYPFGQLNQCHHGRRIRHDGAVPGFDFLAQHGDVPFQALAFQGLLHHQGQVIHIQGFREKIRGSILHGFHGCLNRPMSRHHDDRGAMRQDRLLLPG